MEPEDCGGGRARGRSRGRRNALASSLVEHEPPRRTGGLALQLRQLFLELSGPLESGDTSPETDGTGCGRGARRKPRNEVSMLATRTIHVTDKTGTTGRPIRLVTNYFFRLLSLPQCCVHQYHVDFVPSVESSRMRRALVGDHREQFGRCYVFDGMSDLKTPSRLEQEFDKRAVFAIPQQGLELWQSLVTAGQHETGVLMVTDTVHNVLRRDTVLDSLIDILASAPTGYREIDNA
ncbi:hypothetical protein HPB47_023741 [Ixodes persulcatus]|uniref:Uncharacterized protein n=1 Tax=Ixodes persulcatus TaxID=34615 RepID=A0AC60Q655_IXOPE|nr:hypothetical protein HPB47_023741 [Ixodes persulcatus]